VTSTSGASGAAADVEVDGVLAVRGGDVHRSRAPGLYLTTVDSHSYRSVYFIPAIHCVMLYTKQTKWAFKTNHTDSKPALNTKKSILYKQNCPGFKLILNPHGRNGPTTDGRLACASAAALSIRVWPSPGRVRHYVLTFL
jgi:hypothetical protein